MKLSALPRPQKWVLLGIPALFAVGSFLHFLYDITGQTPVVGIFSPVNESIWEHSKMVLWPAILWWLLYYYLQGKAFGIDQNSWFTAAFFSLLTTLATMPLVYYFYTEAFGVELLWVDILILLLAVSLGQLLGLHIYRHTKGIPSIFVLLLFACVILLFIWFTFAPPQIPLFQDPVTGQYGIYAL